MPLYDSLAKSLIQSEITAQKKTEQQKAKFLEDPKKLDDFVGKVFQQLSPSKRIGKSSNAALLTDRVNATIPKGHPLKNFGQEFKENLYNELARPENKGYSTKEISTGILESMLGEVDPKSQMSRLERAYQAKRLEDTSFFGKDTKAPLALPGMLKYEDWRAARFASEQKLTETEVERGAVDPYLKSIAKVAGISAATAGAFGITGGPVAALAAAGVGLTAGGLVEAVAYPIRRVFEKENEWASARKYSGRWQDSLKLIAAEAGPEIVADIGISAKLIKSAKLLGAAKATASVNPTAANVVTAAKAVKANSKVVKGVVSKLEKTKMAQSDLAAFNKNLDLQARVKALPEKLQTEVLTHPDGVEKGLLIAEEKADALAYTVSEKGSAAVETRKAAKAAKPKRAVQEKIKTATENISPSGVEEGESTLVKEGLQVKSSDPSIQLYERRMASEFGKQTYTGPERRVSLNAQRTTADIDKLEEELVGKRISEISSDPVVKESMTPVKRVSQPEALVDAPKGKAIDELEQYITGSTIPETAEGVTSSIVPKTTRKSAMAELKAITKEGITPTEQLSKIEDLKLAVSNSPELYKAGGKTFLTKLESVSNRLKKEANLVKGMALFGIGAEVFSWFGPSEAEASPLSETAKVVAKTLGKKTPGVYKELLIESLREGQHVVDKVGDDALFLSRKMVQEQLKDSAAGGPSTVLKHLDSFLKTPKSFTARWASADQIFNEVLNIKNKVMNNPAVFKASAMMAETVNVNNGLKVMDNILKASGIKPATKRVSDLFEPLAPLMKSQVGHDYYKKRIGDLSRELGKLSKAPNRTKAVEEAVASTKQQLAMARSKVDKFFPEMQEYHRKWAEVAQRAAVDESSVRVFLAADDDMVKWSKYPFMKNIPLSDSEKLAAGRIKRQMNMYKGRLEEIGVETKEGPFMHYSLHKNVTAAMMEDLVGDMASAPYLKNYSRSLNSRPLVPDVFASMGHYIPDVERRIQTQTFWNGWDKVMNKTRYIEPLRLAFEALKKGTAPIENSFGNTMARWYTNFEVYKRLFLSPSAGLKHLVKLTGDMSTLGVGSTLKALPASAKGVSWRVVENTPFLKKVAKNYLGDDMNAYSKLKKSLFDSVVPVQNTRWRMMQAGFGDYDSHFSKLAIAADQVNHAGGVWINLAELLDRGVSIEAGLNMAYKKGLTAEQALYGIYDTILKNNFLGREFTPSWLRNPKIKALLMFQTTPFKIMQRRLVTAIKAGRSIKNLGQAVEKATRTAEGRQKLFSDLGNLWKDMKLSEREMKSNLVLDALTSESDFYGNSAVKQFVKDIVITGAGTIAGASVGMNLSHHFFHLPFLKSWSTRDSYATLSLSPLAQALLDGHNKWNKRDEDDDEMLVTKVVKSWMGSSGVFPDLVNKFNRIKEDDIPELYRDSKFKYLFAVPATEEE